MASARNRCMGKPPSGIRPDNHNRLPPCETLRKAFSSCRLPDDPRLRECAPLLSGRRRFRMTGSGATLLMASSPVRADGSWSVRTVPAASGWLTSVRTPPPGRSPDSQRGAVAHSRRASHCKACSRVFPHMSSEGCRPLQQAGRSGWPKIAQRQSAVSWTQGTPAGLPCGMPGSGVEIEGAMQQAPHASRQGMGSVIQRFQQAAHRCR